MENFKAELVKQWKTPDGVIFFSKNEADIHIDLLQIKEDLKKIEFEKDLSQEEIFFSFFEDQSEISFELRKKIISAFQKLNNIYKKSASDEKE